MPKAIKCVFCNQRSPKPSWSLWCRKCRVRVAKMSVRDYEILAPWRKRK